VTTGDAAPFLAPSPMERVFNRTFGVLVGLGLGRRHNYLLQVRGRTTGRTHATPVNVLDFDGRRWLVAGRGRTQWVRNAEVAGEIVLRRGRRRERYRLRPVPDAEKPPVLAAYLARFALTVQRYFPVRAGAPAAELAGLAARYPVFELRPADPGPVSR
jgi:deazaflavin-dependent oxidoreductase (nitroreductase family)